MDIAAIPFNRFLGLRAEGAALSLPEDANYLNHLGTVHASAQFALAEAASGQWLLDRFGTEAANHLAVVRQVSVKFRRPATGELTAEAGAAAEVADAFLETLARRGRATIEVSVRLLDAGRNVTLEAAFEWFAQRLKS